MKLNLITQKYTKLFPGDFSGNTMQRQTADVMFCTVEPADFEKTELIDFNENLAEEI